MMKDVPCFLKGFVCAFSRLTNFRLPVMKPDPVTVKRSLLYYPLAGLYIGIASSLLVMLIVTYCSVLQSFVLFAGCIYVVLLAWFSGFSGYRAFAQFFDAVSRKNLPPAERYAALQSETLQAPGMTACALLAASKILIVYLLFTRLVLFDRTMLLGFILLSAPVLARCVTLAMTTYPASPLEPETTIAGKGNKYAVLVLILVLAGISAVFLGLAHGFGEYCSIFSPAESMHNIRQITASLQQNKDMFEILLIKGVRDTGFLLIAGFLVHMYISGESKAAFGGITDSGAGAAAEAGETAVLAAFLLVADYMLF